MFLCPLGREQGPDLIQSVGDRGALLTRQARFRFHRDQNPACQGAVWGPAAAHSRDERLCASHWLRGGQSRENPIHVGLREEEIGNFSLFLASDTSPSGTSGAPLPNQAYPEPALSTSLEPRGSLSVSLPCLARRSSKSVGFSHRSSGSRGWRDRQSRKELREPVQCWLHTRPGDTPA